MNGGSGSRPPAKNPITRPVSFHSLSEHNRNNPTYLSPYSHRRPRTPRSSPLAGPSLSSDEVDNEKKDEDVDRKPRYRPNRISSTPDMVGPIQSLYDSDTASFQSPPSVTSISAPPPSTSSSSSSSSEDDKEKDSGKGKEEVVEDGSRFRNFAKRLSIISTSSLTTSETGNKRRSSLALHSASTTSLASTSSSRTHRTDQTSQTAPPIPTIPRWALNAMREEAGVANRNVKYGHRRGTSDDLNTSSSLPPLPNQPIPRGVPLSGLSNHPRPPSTSRDPAENWVSMTDPIPKFSRLALKGEGVVLPVSKKESLAKMKSSSSIKSTATITKPADTRRVSGTTTRTEPNHGSGSNHPPNPTITEANLKEEALRKRSSWAGSLRTRIPKIGVSSSAHSENVPPLPPFVNKSDPASVSDSRTSASEPPNTSVFPVLTSDTRRSTTSRRDSVLAAIDEGRLPPPPHDPESGMRAGNDKSKDAHKARARRKSIKQIVMRITTAPISAGEKLKFGTIHKSNPVVVMPIDPPPAAWTGEPANASVPSLHSTTETPELACGQADGRGHKKFRGIKKRWNAVLATVRR